MREEIKEYFEKHPEVKKCLKFAGVFTTAYFVGVHRGRNSLRQLIIRDKDKGIEIATNAYFKSKKAAERHVNFLSILRDYQEV